jgi:hypothetical protein
MVGLIVVSVIIVYVLLSKFIVTKVLQRYGLKKANIALVIMILIPMWDTILYYPIYWILSNTIPKIERFQSPQKIEGFYKGYMPDDMIIFNMYLYDTFDNNYSIYFDKNDKYDKTTKTRTKKYYKAHWLNDSKSSLCVPPLAGSMRAKYQKELENNWCVAVEEIKQDDMTQYWKLEQKIIAHIPILYMNIYIVDFYVSSRNNEERFFRLRDVFVDKSWLTAVNIVSGEKATSSGTDFTRLFKGSTKNHFELNEDSIVKILTSKQKIEEK